mgnify:CR=1 FL=1
MQLVKRIVKGIINRLAPSYLPNRTQRLREKKYYKKHKHLRKTQKIIYTLTPPPRLSNIGDHAQVVAILKWISDNYPNTPVLEVDKDECTSMIKPLKKLVQKDDLIFIHSGGNLGDRGMWSETGRRAIIQNFPNNQIVSLPQTIHFSATQKGEAEKQKTIEIYNKHENLTVIGRDPESGRLAKEMFPNCKTFSMPDFVLYLTATDIIKTRNQNPAGTLLCLRNDNESILSKEEGNSLKSLVNKPVEFFDTTIEQPIPNDKRFNYLKRTIEYFDQFETIITDRYHGLIFASILQKPTIVLPTVDHKLTSAYEWFKDINNIKFIEVTQIAHITKIQQDLNLQITNKKEWKSRYFNELREII